MLIVQRLYYTSIFVSLVGLDYVIGNGFVDGFQRLFRAVSGSSNSSVVQDKMAPTVTEPSISLHVFVVEIFVLMITMFILNRYKLRDSKDHIDVLLQESKDTLKRTNDLLEKWRQTRVPTKYSYLYDEPQTKPLKFEVPVLHMAIIDKRTPSNMPERGDASNVVNVTDSELLSVTSLLDDDIESIPEGASIAEANKLMSDAQKVEYLNRFCNMDRAVI